MFFGQMVDELTLYSILNFNSVAVPEPPSVLSEITFYMRYATQIFLSIWFSSPTSYLYY